MKQEFRIVRDRPKVTILLTRDSVCAGDDADDHDRTVDIDSFTDPAVLISRLAPGYLPSIAGFGHSWQCILNGELLATLSVDGVVAHAREVVYATDSNHIHFRYRSATY